MEFCENFKEFISFAESTDCEVRLEQSLKEYTTFRIGGECKGVFMPRTKEALAKLLVKANELKLDYQVIGNGSNLLCDDKGYHGFIFKIGKNMENIRAVSDTEIRVCAGASLAKLCNFALDNSLTGLEFAYGIPGTVGGAVFMNAGAYGGEIKDVLVSCETVDGKGEFHTYSNEELLLGYRRSIFHEKTNEVILSAVFKLAKGNKNEIFAKMNELMAKRKEKQPLEYPNAGSTFKRPEGQFAGKLIQDCNLRGFSVGGAEVSEKHCGFVINRDNATFEDVMGVISHVQETVKSKTGYFLECEVKILKY